MNLFTEPYFEIADSGDIVRLEPINLPNPNAELDWDRNYLRTKVTVKAGPFNGQFISEFMTTDFEMFKRDLLKLENDFNGSVTFEPVEQQLVLKIKGDGLGHFEVDCIATPEPHLGQSLEFSLTFDQTQIKEYVRQLHKITKAFPVDGDFKLDRE